MSVKDAIEKLERPTGVPMLSLTSSSVILCVLRDDLLIFRVALYSHCWQGSLRHSWTDLMCLERLLLSAVLY